MDYTFGSLSVLSLNVKGLRDLVKRKAIFLFCKRSNADLIFLQETHSEDADLKFWKAQWGNTIFASHGSSHSAGVMTLIHKFKGDIIKVVESKDGRWITMVIKQDNTFFSLCNIYGFNSHSSNMILFSQISAKVKELLADYKGSYVILGGDFNECMDDALDRYPPRPSNVALRNNLILSLCSDLSLTDAWRFYNPDSLDYTWSNKNLSLRSRIDFFFNFLFNSSSYQRHFSCLCSPIRLQTNFITTWRAAA